MENKVDVGDELDFELVESPGISFEQVLSDSNFYGYRNDLENKQKLIDESLDSEIVMLSCQGEYPEQIDPRIWHRIEMQGNMGSCQGHALSSIQEHAYYIKTGRIKQFSPLFAYYATQEIDGLSGRDAGSTISGGLKCAQTYGACPLEEMPYPNPVKYRWGISQHAKDVAKDFLIKNHLYCKTYDHVFTWLASGQGGVEIGISWNNSYTPNSEGVIESVSNGGGGHAVSFLGYSTRKDADGRKYLWLANSWDVTWGNKGWAEVSPRAVMQMLSSSMTVMIGMTDLSVPNFRKIDYSLW